MNMSAEFCRLQAEVERRRGVDSPLDNVRRIAIVAAATWESEARAAEQREALRSKARSWTEAKVQAIDTLGSSENPDRGRAG